MTDLTAAQRLRVAATAGSNFTVEFTPDQAIKWAVYIEAMDAAMARYKAVEAQYQVAKALANKAAWSCGALSVINAVILAVEIGKLIK